MSDEILNPDLDEDLENDDDQDDEDEFDGKDGHVKQTQAAAELEQLAAAHQKKSGETFAEAYKTVLQWNPALYSAYLKERKAQIARMEQA